MRLPVSTLNETAEDASLAAKKYALQKIFGSNLYLKNEKVFRTAKPQYAPLAASRENFLVRFPDIQGEQNGVAVSCPIDFGVRPERNSCYDLGATTRR